MSTTPITSATFGETTGDFALISSDDTIFYVPRLVLQLSSKVFETMFKVGTESAEDSVPIRMQATAKELEMVLKFAHPGHKNPVLGGVTTLVNLLRVAKQYEMDVVLDNLREWLVKPRYENGVSIEPIAVREPLVSLVAAVSFEFQDEARFALQEVLKCDFGKELDKAQRCDIPMSLMRPLYKLRAERVAWYTEKVTDVSEALVVDYSHQKPTIIQEHAFGDTPTFGFGGPPIQPTNKENSATDFRRCIRWQYTAMKGLEERPTFQTFKCHVDQETGGTTGQGVFHGSDIQATVRKLMQDWEAEAAMLESKFPELNAAPVGEV